MYDIRSKSTYDINENMAFDRITVERMVKDAFGINLSDMTNIQLNSLAEYIQAQDEKYSSVISKQLSVHTDISAIRTYYVAYQKELLKLKKEADSLINEQRKKLEAQNTDSDVLARSLESFSGRVNSRVEMDLERPRKILAQKLHAYQKEFGQQKNRKMKLDILTKKKEILNDPNYQTRDNYKPSPKIDKDDPRYNLYRNKKRLIAEEKDRERRVRGIKPKKPKQKPLPEVSSVSSVRKRKKGILASLFDRNK